MAANPYETLGVDPSADQEKIKSAYRKLAKKFHPDLNPGNKKAESRFKDIASAYDLVGNADDRAKFDRGKVEAEAAKQYGSRTRGPFYSETQAGGGRYSNQFEGMDDDILSSLFEQMGRPKDGRFQRAPENKLFQMNVDFKDSILGGEQEIVFPGGKKFLVKIPAGVESGTKLRFKGKNESHMPGAFPGDIYVQLNVKPSSIFKKIGKDVEVELSVSFSDAILEAEVQVPTVDGAIIMKIPAKVTSNQKLRLKGKGVLNNVTKMRGDQITILKIKMPENVDDEFRKAVEDWTKRQTKESL